MTTPDLLFHTLLTVIDFHTDTSGATRNVYVLGTHTTLPAAKAFSQQALHTLGYEPDDFDVYETKTASNSDQWTHGDGVTVYAKAPAGQEFVISIDTTANDEQLPSGENDTPKLPVGHDSLHYVLQTKTDYNQDRSGMNIRTWAFQSCEIEGCYVNRKDALVAAKNALSGMDRESFQQYDERDSPEEKGQWPFGEDVVVHAVAETGENYSVCVRTVAGAHKRYAKKK